MKTLGFIILFSTICQNLFCQNSTKLDSMLKILPNQKEDSLKVKTQIRICHQYLDSDPEKVLLYSQQALQLAEKVNWKKGIGMAHSLIGDAYYYKGEYQEALKHRQSEFQIWVELGMRWQICSTLGNIGVIYSDLGDNAKALDYYFQTLRVADRIKHYRTYVSTLSNIGSVYNAMGDSGQALKFYRTSLSYADKHEYKDLALISLENMGGIYADNKLYAKAFSCYQIALQSEEKDRNMINIPSLLANIGILYQNQGDSADSAHNNSLANEKRKIAMEYFNKALTKSTEIGNIFIQANVHSYIALIEIKDKNYTKAKEHLDISIEQALSVGSKELFRQIHQGFYELYKSTGQFEKALEHYEKHIVFKDSVFNQESRNAIAKLQSKYDNEKRETENYALAQQNKILTLSVENHKYLTVGLLVLLLLAFGIGILIFRQAKLRSRQEYVRLEQKLLRAQMNPHFIFNSLSSIESFIYEHQPKEAGNYLSQFALLMRLILENSASEYITLEKELETLKCYLSLQKLRLNDNLKYQIHVDDRINTEEIRIPPMLTQPFIENVIEHGFRGIKECGVIDITFKLKEGYLEIRVIDNGIGLVQAQQQKELYKNHKSMAIGITYERLKFLNKSKKQKLIFSIKEASGESDGKGTEVVFSIPV